LLNSEQSTSKLAAPIMLNVVAENRAMSYVISCQATLMA
jgi:hypothetical protein